MFVFAIKSGKQNLQLEKQIYENKRSVLEKTPLLPGNGKCFAVLTDADCNTRVTLYQDGTRSKTEIASFFVEDFDQSFRLTCRYSSDSYYEAGGLLEYFAGLWNITDNYFSTINKQGLNE